MTPAAPTSAPATIQPAFTGAERLPLVGFLAAYCSPTREAYVLDLRGVLCPEQVAAAAFTQTSGLTAVQVAGV
jgi:hypothetical protein